MNPLPLCLVALPVAVVSNLQCFSCYGPADAVMDQVYPRRYTAKNNPEPCLPILNASQLIKCPRTMKYCVEMMVGPDVYKGCGDEKYANMIGCFGAAHPERAVPMMMCSCNFSMCNYNFQEYQPFSEPLTPAPMVDTDYFYVDSASRLNVPLTISGIVLLALINLLNN